MSDSTKTPLQLQIEEAEAKAARGEEPYIDPFLFESGFFKSREEYDELQKRPLKLVSYAEFKRAKPAKGRAKSK